MALGQFIIASAASFWYFTRRSALKAPVFRSVVRGLFNHIGSLAFGSFLISVVWMVKALFRYMKVFTFYLFNYFKKTISVNEPTGI